MGEGGRSGKTKLIDGIKMILTPFNEQKEITCHFTIVL